MSSSPDKVAITFAGAVANGAFEAGALEVLAEEGFPFKKVLGASAGALNATVFARYLLAGDPRGGARALVALWRTEATFLRIFRPSPRGIASLTGLSDQRGLVDILRRQVAPVPDAGIDLDLYVVVTSLQGLKSDIGGTPATTHEGVCHFDKRDFASRERLEQVFQAAAASAAFPVAFVPSHVRGFGPCSDGGIVNNTPLAHVIDPDIGRVVVVVPSPRVSHEHPPKGIGALAWRISDVIVQERLYRDLRAAEKVNGRVGALDALGAKFTDKSLLYDARVAAGLGGKRRVQFLEVRPERVLPNPFAGFFSRKLREALIEKGRLAARKALRADGWASAVVAPAPPRAARLASGA